MVLYVEAKQREVDYMYIRRGAEVGSEKEGSDRG
jgi:hypothetical protein